MPQDKTKIPQDEQLKPSDQKADHHNVSDPSTSPPDDTVPPDIYQQDEVIHSIRLASDKNTIPSDKEKKAG